MHEQSITPAESRGDPASDQWPVVLGALTNTAYDYRSAAAIAKETKLPEEAVERLLRVHRSELRRRGDHFGRRYYALKSRPVKLREVLDDIKIYASKSL